ncbi:MAG: AEC family transporter [Candidatus Aminicenantes bacterium]|nr:AEC family transporter [Candidatus Aminicenantes bacterium]
MFQIFLRSIVPLLLLIGAGFFSRYFGILKRGDERVLSAYVFFFALPSLFFVNISSIHFTSREFRFVIASALPSIIALVFYLSLYFTFKFKRENLFLLILVTVFGSTAFFGIPFIMFAFPGIEPERLATLAAASTSLVGVFIGITVLEFHAIGEASLGKAVRIVLRRLSRNPLILSIILGVIFSLFKIEMPHPLNTALHMLGRTTATVAVFMLGVFLYGKNYSKFFLEFKLSLLRIVAFPVVALVSSLFLGISGIERTVVVLMHGMPVAVSLIILSERYNFQKKAIAPAILISSLVSGLHLNLWIFVLGLIK